MEDIVIEATPGSGAVDSFKQLTTVLQGLEQGGTLMPALSSYYVGYLVKQDADLRNRVAACAQQQADAAVVDIGDPQVWAEENSWAYAMAPGWVGKVESAIANGIVAWGQDPTVITDGDILSWTQPEITGGA